MKKTLKIPKIYLTVSIVIVIFHLILIFMKDNTYVYSPSDFSYLILSYFMFLVIGFILKFIFRKEKNIKLMNMINIGIVINILAFAISSSVIS